MVLKVQLVTATDATALQTAVNLFLADKVIADVLDIQWPPLTLGKNPVLACAITYQE